MVSTSRLFVISSHKKWINSVVGPSSWVLKIPQAKQKQPSMITLKLKKKKKIQHWWVCGTLEHLYLISNDLFPLVRTVTWHVTQTHSILELPGTCFSLRESLGSLIFFLSLWCNSLITCLECAFLVLLKIQLSTLPNPLLPFLELSCLLLRARG